MKNILKKLKRLFVTTDEVYVVVVVTLADRNIAVALVTRDQKSAIDYMTRHNELARYQGVSTAWFFKSTIR
jgi:hypothetical protein|tara:strand:+ start:212 stop:424 length:213 start_codon:yes stop_codon:yes gene_type:complete